MPTEVIFRVNYYVGAMLAQGGNLRVDDTQILFSPTSPIDRAMGAKDVMIPLKDIKGVECSGVLSRTVRIKTSEKTHKFEGAQTQKVWELLQKRMPEKATSIAVSATSPILAVHTNAVQSPPAHAAPHNGKPNSCHQCSEVLQPGYCFCPHCGVRPKSACKACQRTVDPNWIACAYCGSKNIAKAA